MKEQVEQAPAAKRSRRIPLRRHVTAWVALAFPAFACVLDTDDLCGPNQVIWGDDDRCVCAEGMGYTPQGCVPCGSNEISSPAGCVCNAGYARPAAGQACEEVQIGAPCTADAECSNPLYTHCQVTPFGGYCTAAGCASSAECTSGYACDTGASPSYCKRPPVGAGVACALPEDCAGTEALFCDTFVSLSCLVQDCDDAANPCFEGTECCPFGGVNICIPAGACLQ